MEGAVFPKSRSTFRPATPNTGKAQSLSSRDEVSSMVDESANGEEKATEEQSGEGPANAAAEGEAQPDGSVHAEPNGSLTVKMSEAGNMPLSASTIVEDDGLYASDGHDTGLNATHRPLTTSELFLKDAFLIFRSMCKLTMKSLFTESEREMKSHSMRSKLLSLHMVLIILNSHMDIFVNPYSMVYSNNSRDPVPFIQMANQYLCLTLSRKALSPVPQMFEVSVEIFWRVLSGLRTKLKKEIGVLFHEIFIPVLELKTSTLKQKSVILEMLSRLCQDPQALVKLFLNYDCDSKAIDNIYEHLMNILTKIAAASQRTANHPTASPGLHPTKSQHNHSSNIAPSLSTSALSVPGSLDTTTLGQSEQQLRRQGLKSLVAVLKSLVAWGTASGKSAADVVKEARASSASARGKTMLEDRDRERSASASGSMAEGISPDQ